MYKIQANQSGTRTIEVSDQHLETIRKYSLLQGLIDSNGIVDEDVLDKLKFNIRSMLESESGQDKALLDLCLDVIYNTNMKAFGLHKLIMLYIDWDSKNLNRELERSYKAICSIHKNRAKSYWLTITPHHNSSI